MDTYADILRELLTSDLKKFTHSAQQTADAVKEWRQAHGIDSGVPLWHALTSVLAWSYAQPWAEQIDECTLVHKWCYIVSRNEEDTFNADTAMLFSENAAEIFSVIPEDKKPAFAVASFSAVHRVLGVYFDHDYQQDDDDHCLDPGDVAHMMVGLGTLANVAPDALSTWDKAPLHTAWLSLAYDMWGMLPKRGDDATTMAYFLDSSLPEAFKRTALFAMSGDTWANMTASCASALAAFLPQEEHERATVLPWVNIRWGLSPSAHLVDRAMRVNTALAQAFCPLLCTHLHLLDSEELWTSKDFILHMAQMQAKTNAAPTLPLPNNEEVGAIFSH